MTDISLQVENGKIVAYDEQGNKVPLPAEAIATIDECPMSTTPSAFSPQSTTRQGLSGVPNSNGPRETVFPRSVSRSDILITFCPKITDKFDQVLTTKRV
jgi:hypothetical protein